MKFYLYDPAFNYKYELEGISKISDFKQRPELVELLGVSISTLNESYKDRRVIRRIGKLLIDETVKADELVKIYSSMNYEDEGWKAIEECEDNCYISNYGRVKKVYKSKPEGVIKSIYPSNRLVLTKDLELIQIKSNNKTTIRMLVKIKVNGKYKEVLVSNLVAKYFLGDKKDGEVVSRINEKFYDNRACNLEYISKSESGKRTGYYSRSQEVAKICPETGKELDRYKSVREAGRENFMSYQTVLDNLNGLTKLAFNEYKFIYV